MINNSVSWSDVIAPTYAHPNIKIVSGVGTEVFDDHGKSYLDFLSGIAVNALGHCHPAIVDAVSRQLTTLGHVSNLYTNPVTEKLAHKLLEITGFQNGKVFFCNSGAEANEAAIKYVRAAKPKSRMVSLNGGFHGRTMGALSITGQKEKRESFEPLLQKVDFIDPDNHKQLKKISKRTGGVWLEVIQGEGGVLPLSEDYLKEVVKATASARALLVVDEVQTGIGRTGTWFSYQRHNISPDLVPIAKGLGGGLPIGALAISSDYAQSVKPGGHGTTYGGNPIAAAASLAVIETIENENLLANVALQSKTLISILGNLPEIESIRGDGLLLGLVFKSEIAKKIEAKALELGLLVNAVRPNIIRLAPPLNTSTAQIQQAAEILKTAVVDVISNG